MSVVCYLMFVKVVFLRSIDELRKDSVDTICALAVALGADFAVFVPSVRKPMQRHHVTVNAKLSCDEYTRSPVTNFSWIDAFE